MGSDDTPAIPNPPTDNHDNEALADSDIDLDEKSSSSEEHPTRGNGRTIALSILVVIALTACVFGGMYVFKKISRSAIEPGQSVIVTIEKGTSATGIADKLETAGVVDDSLDFLKYVTDAGTNNSLIAGVYTFTTGSDNETVMQALISGPGESDIALTVPEGFTIEQTAARVEETYGIPAADFITLAHSATTYEPDYPFLAGAYNNSLEGYLFPKTYYAPEGATADTIIRLMLDQFAAESSSLDLTYPTSKGLNMAQVVTMASLIEREALFEEDRPHVAGVIYNRLDENMPLALDATIYYALGQTGGPALAYDDLKVDSPYNTYVNEGLPPGPINSPGLASLQAACSPTITSDHYFILTSEYSHFYVTYEEFLKGADEYYAENGIQN